MTAQNKRLTGILLTVGGLLLIPLIAMQFPNGVDWSLFDFIIAGLLLGGTGIVIELILRKVQSKKRRLMLCALALLVLALIWIELAVGLFGSPIAGS